MARYLILWRRNPVAPWPRDPDEYSKLLEMSWAGIDGLIRKGEIKEFGWFLDGISGYAMGEGDGGTVLKNVSMFTTYWDFEVHEIVPHEKGKEIVRALVKAQIEAMKK